MERRKIVTLPSPTCQGSQTWCTVLIPGIYCGVGVRVISVVFYTCRSRWFRSAIAAFVRFTKAGVGNWKWGQSPCHRSHRHVSQIPQNFKGCHSLLDDVQPDHNECRVLLFLSEVEMVGAMCFLRWCLPLWSAVPLNWMSSCRNVDGFRYSLLYVLSLVKAL